GDPCVWSRVILALGAVRFSLILLGLLVPTQAVVRAVLDGNSSTVEFADLPALFGVPLAPEGVRGYLTEARPANACHPIEGPRPGNGSLGAIVLIRRYDCTFDLKVLHAQQAGFQAAVVYNATSQDLRVIVCCDKLVHILLLPDHPACPDLDCHPMLAISWVLGCTLALLVTAFFVLWYLWNWLRAWWARGPVVKAWASQRAQVSTFTRLHDLCAICLDEYEEGDQLKILPCSHTYHCKCINPWFSQPTRRSCPVCKQSVVSTEDSSDSTVSSYGYEEDPSLPGHRPPIWAIQTRLRSRRLELATSVGATETSESLEGPPEPL
uniref:E3 ubiquitin-protein ligase ZNRF4 n=1 Tax=Phocoena sinus TaxID=42100 RepID=A0A8C9E6C5_PHOSS